MNLGDRIKENYENRYRFYLTRRTPVIIRIDGVAFHTFTRGLDRPFDFDLINAMIATTKAVSLKMQGFKCAYVQSDEISILLTDYDNINTCAWFDYNKSKIESVSASLFTTYFNNCFKKNNKTAYFDARSFNIPASEVVNYFLWRAQDWERNSLNMYASEFYSHRELHGKNKSDKHEMLYQKGKNWNELSNTLKNGTFIFKDETVSNILPSYQSINDKLLGFL